MANFNDPTRTLSLMSMGCAVQSGIWEPYVPASEAAQVLHDCSEHSVNHVSCQNSRLSEFISDVGGLAFDTAPAESYIPELPKLIPMLERSFIWSNPSSIPSDVVAISFSDVFKNSPRGIGGVLQTNGPLRFNERITESSMFDRKFVVLNMSGQDALIERAWMQQDDISLFENLHRLGFRFATTPNFSVFGGECAIGHRINQKKSMVCASLLQKAGIAPILHVYIMNEHHLNEYAAYLQANPAVKVITINCTRQRKEPNEVERIRAAVAHLLSVRGDLRIILQGLNVKDAKLFCEFNANLHYMVSTPTHNALMRKEALYDPRNVSISTLHGSERGKGELAELNMHAYNAFFQNVCAVE